MGVSGRLDKSSAIQNETIKVTGRGEEGCGGGGMFFFCADGFVEAKTISMLLDNRSIEVSIIVQTSPCGKCRASQEINSLTDADVNNACKNTADYNALAQRVGTNCCATDDSNDDGCYAERVKDSCKNWGFMFHTRSFLDLFRAEFHQTNSAPSKFFCRTKFFQNLTNGTCSPQPPLV